MSVFRRIGVSLLLFAGLVLTSLNFTATAQGQGKKDSKEPAVKTGAERVDWNKTKVAFDMRGKPWSTAIPWFCNQVGMPLTGKIGPPTGTVSFYNVNGPDSKGRQPGDKGYEPTPREYSLTEVFDILNEMLMAEHKHILLRRETTLMLFPADEAIPKILVPRVTVESLPQRGNTEIVECVIKLKGDLNAEEFAPHAKRLLGDFASVTPIPDTNQLICQADVFSLRRHLATFMGTGDEKEQDAHLIARQCKYIRAAMAEQLVRNALGDLRQSIEVKTSPDKSGPGGGGDNPMGGGGMFGGKGGGPGAGGGGGNVQKRVRITTVTSNKTTNTVFVTGPSDKVATATKVLDKADVAQGVGDKGILIGPPTFRTHEVPQGDADLMAKVLSDIYKDDNTIRITVNPPSRLFVYADPQTHYEINLLVNSDPPQAQKHDLIPLARLDATKFAESLKGIFPGSKNGSPFIEADTEGNAIRLRGTPQQIEQVKMAIKAYDGGLESAGGGVRMITLDKGSGATVAEALQQLFPQIRPNPLTVNLPGTGSMGEKKDKDNGNGGKEQSKPEPVPLPKGSIPKSDAHNFRMTPDMVRQAMYQQTGGTRYAPVSAQAQDKDKQPDKVEPTTQPQPDKKKAPVVITAFGNRILITSDDPEALDVLQQMIRILVNTEAGPGDFVVERLQYANAVEVAKILDEAFNGPKGGQGGPGGGRGGGGFQLPGIAGIMTGALGVGQQPSARTENIRVVADPGTNSLLIRAKPIDMMTIKRLLKQSIDTRDLDSQAITKTFVIGPLENARATNVAEILERVYYDSVNSRQSSVTASSVPGGGSFFNSQRSVDPVANRTAMLSVGVDNTTNSIVVGCPTTLFKDIETLVKELDKAAGKNKEVVKIIPVSDIDPYVLQAAIDAISGKQTASAAQRGNFGSTMGPGSFAPGAFGTPGRGTGNFGGGNFGGGNFGGGGFPGGGGFGGGNPGGGFGALFGGGNPGGGAFGGAGPGGGGAFRGGGTPGGGGGGFAPGGGGGGARPGGGRPGGGTRPGGVRGSDFFEQRVMDDPAAANVNVLFDPASEPVNVLYDPSEDFPVSFNVNHSEELAPPPPVYTANPFYFASYLQPEGQPIIPEKVQPPKDSKELNAPRLTTDIVVLPGLSGIMIKAQNQQDLEQIMRIIDAIKGVSAGAKVEIQLVPVRFGDPTQIVGQLNTFLARVQMDPNFIRIGTTQGGGLGGILGGGAAGGQQQVPVGVVLLAQPRLSSILIAAPAGRMREIIGLIQQFDSLPSDANAAVIFPLKHAPASQVAAALNAFYVGTGTGGGAGATGGAGRYSPPDPAGYNQIRITSDVHSNSVIVQASPGDLKEIRRLIEHLDNVGSSAKTDLRVVPLKNAVAADLADLLRASIGTGTLTAQSTLGLTPATTVAGPGGTTTTQGANQIANTKTSTVAFVGPNTKDGKPVQSDLMEDIRINFDVRTNALIVSAPGKTMPLILALIAELDVQPNARMEINIFTLKKADATQMALTLQRLFLGVGGLGSTGTGGGGGGGLPAATAGGTTGLGTAGAAGTLRPIQITVQGITPDGPPIIDLRLTIDERTNSIIVAGSRADLLTVGSIIARIEDAKTDDRISQAVRLRNANATDVVNALTTLVNNTQTIYSKYGQETNSLGIKRDVVLVAEPITNSVLINATPMLFDTYLRMISQLDTTPPQVVVQVLIAEVTLNGNEEFGVELGLQSPVLFQRGLVPGNVGTPGGTTTVTYTTGATAPATPGVFGPSGSYSFLQAIGAPGYFFRDNPNNSLPTRTDVDPGKVGFQGISNLGVGRVSSTSNIGGFVFSAQGNVVSALVRALKTQERLLVLSRPQVQTLDKQAAVITAGTEIPLITGSNVTATGVISTSTERKQIGVTLQVTPSITPDGRVLMRVIPEVSAVQSTAFPLGNGTFGTSLSIRHLETTINVEDGETVILGGLITKGSDKNENKAPWLGDLPGVGALFRYRTEQRQKTELIIIMTPHIVRNRDERERVLAEESRRIDWCLADVMRVHGNSPVLMPTVPTIPPEACQPYRIIPQSNFPPNPQLQQMPTGYSMPPKAAPAADVNAAKPQPQPREWNTPPMSIPSVPAGSNNNNGANNVAIPRVPEASMKQPLPIDTGANGPAAPYLMPAGYAAPKSLPAGQGYITPADLVRPTVPTDTSAKAPAEAALPRAMPSGTQTITPADLVRPSVPHVDAVPGDAPIILPSTTTYYKDEKSK